ncbi:MAG: sulfite exporter TauE/SafE family protein [Methylocystis sp.]|nr:sulfite exporter TauE/SafE family protein [Methylocystis sp.]MCA3582988.1 sulfite exporter TauE/SafE family protein [Methylocystis sp.]MCA3587311.1 sulfite exporter TauE/SafE family protein [Methylocystis sp.]MCA3590393.1 sulfite exporter TauE/SafE family protein [Methylocystis sp.]
MLDFLLPQGVSLTIAVLLLIVSFFTSALTAAFGIGGGVAMLGALAGTVSPALVVAVHGVVQLGSNFGRVILQRAHILWRPTLLFTAGSVVGAVLGALVFVALPEKLLLAILGAFILLLAWIPKPRIPGLETTGVAIGGLIATFVTIFVGATGPFVQALFLPLKLGRRALVATHAACMVIQHGLKVVAFGYLGFAFGDWLPLIGLMIAAGFLGTWAGTRLLDKLPQVMFETILRILLTIIALDLLRRAVL